MTLRRRWPTGRILAAAAALAALAAGGCAPADGRSADRPGTGTAPHQEDPVRIRLTVGSQQATATLADNAAARDLASMLPLTVAMGDLFGREKPGPLPRALTGDVGHVDTYRVGQLGYWPADHNLFVVYAGDGLSVPAPGLVPLGTVDTGLDAIAGAGDDFELTITALD